MSDMITMTCVNHDAAVYYTKGAGRSLHFIKADPSMVRAWFAKERLAMTPTDDMIDAFVNCPAPSMECPCPASDLVIVRDEVDSFGHIVPTSEKGATRTITTTLGKVHFFG